MKNKRKRTRPLEDVRASNNAFTQLKVSEFISTFFAMLGLACVIVASEIASRYNANGQRD